VDFSLKFFLFLFHEGGEKCTSENRKKIFKDGVVDQKIFSPDPDPTF
jgi:hypothetical protein